MSRSYMNSRIDIKTSEEKARDESPDGKIPSSFYGPPKQPDNPTIEPYRYDSTYFGGSEPSTNKE